MHHDSHTGQADLHSGLLSSQTNYATLLGASGGRAVRTTATGRGGDLLIALYESPPYDLKVAPMTIPRLSINLLSAPVSGKLAGDRPRTYAGERFSAFLTPADADAHWVKTQRSRHLNLYFSPSLVDELGASRVHDCRTPLLGCNLTRHRSLIQALHRACTLATPRAEEAALGLAYLLLDDVLVAPRQRVAMGPGQLSLVKDYIREHLAQPVRVADLAALVGLTPAQFTLAFRTRLGCTPHRFLMRQRLATAIRMLRGSDRPIADIAVDCGFSSQQHLTTAMRQATGHTPGVFR